MRLAPSKDLLIGYKQGTIDELQFSKTFLNYLETLDKQQFLEEWGDDDVVLLCYEKSEDFCHRHLVKEWLGAKEIVRPN